MISAWTVTINLLTRSNFGLVASNIARQAEGLEVKAGSLTRKLNGVGNAATLAAGAIALIGGTALTTAVTQAAKLQQILLSIKNETGASNAQLSGIYGDIFRIGDRSGMTPVEAGEIWRTVSRMTAGQMSIAQMRQVAPLVADFASMIHFNRPDIDVNQAALVGLSTSHLFRAYNEKALNPLLDKVYRLSGLMGETPDQALRQMSYYEPMFKGMGINDETSIAMMALLDRAGFRNKVGTNVRAMLLQALGPLQLTAHAQQGKAGLLGQMGIFQGGRFAFDNADGSTNFMGVLMQVARWEHEQRAKGVSQSTLTKELFSVFGRQGGTVAALMADPQMVAFLGQIRGYLGDPAVSMQAGLKNRDQSVIFQFGRAEANLVAVLTELGTPWLKDLAGFFHGLADNLHGFQAWLHGHRDAEKVIGVALAGITGIAALFAGALGMSLLTAPLKIGALTTSINLLARAALAATPELAALDTAMGASGVAGAAGTARKGLLGVALAFSRIAGVLSLPIFAALFAWAAAGATRKYAAQTGGRDLSTDARMGNYGVGPLGGLGGTPIPPQSHRRGMGHVVHINVNAPFHAPHDGPEMKRAAKRHIAAVADATAKVVSQTMRAYKGGAMPALAGASPLEFVGNNA